MNGFYLNIYLQRSVRCIILTGFFLFFLSLFYFTLPKHSFVKLRFDDDSLKPSDRFENLFWFIQISDIHISIHHDPKRVSDLKDFLQTSVDVINPSLILATGDLIDAKSKDGFSTQANLEEWRTYYSLLHDTNIEAKIPWLDLRGNHDCFDVKHRNHESNGFRKYSAMGNKQNLGSYMYVHNTDFGTYSFIGIDACPKPGLKRPFNFFGVLTDRDIAELRLMARSTVSHNYTIWFSHYPTTTLAVNYNTALRPAIETTNTLAYLCGHLHHLGGLSYTMYTRQPEGHMELELADWKVNRRYRIMAIDHDLASFIDANYLEWPVILVTNPKESSLSAPIVEPLIRMKFSTHIRILIFSPYFIESVFARIDGKILKDHGRHIKGPLFAIPWNPKDYAQGSHKIHVEVTSLGKITSVTSSFSMDEQIPLYSIISNYILSSHLPSLVFYLFCIVWVSFIILIVILLFGPIEIFNIPCFYWTRSIKQYPRVAWNSQHPTFTLRRQESAALTHKLQLEGYIQFCWVRMFGKISSSA
ncbi:Transmembrane protein 62 isoform X3 [Oopsacas minuta]|uniref:Transmembrane protein 62 isoform X3 n=1 Tax=Oopsacas minuta TaxID=111878 RepID=A0AAV7KKT9_9METZ|nr:Transmembrane protein 62 isoform X3 [Oopsacas minuta]